MTRTRTLSALVGALAVGGLLFVATPASAAVAVLPEQDDLYGVTDWESETEEDFIQLLAVDSTTAAGTEIGPGVLTPAYFGMGQAAYDSLRDVSWVTYLTYDGEFIHSWLATVDVATGDVTTIGEILDNEGGAFHINGVMVGDDGIIYAVEEQEDGLYILDPTTAVASFVGELLHTHSFAYDPVTDSFYAIDHNGYELVEVDVATGATTLVATWGEVVPEGWYDSHSMQFDSNGAMWFQTWGNDEDEVIATYTIGSGVLAEEVGSPSVGGDEVDLDPSILITRGDPVVAPVEPTLAATGSDAGPVVLFGGLLLAAGAAVVLGRVASRRSAV